MPFYGGEGMIEYFGRNVICLKHGANQGHQLGAKSLLTPASLYGNTEINFLVRLMDPG